MVLKKRVPVYCSLDKFNKFNEAQFIEDFKEHNACLLDAHNIVHNDHFVVTMDLKNEFLQMAPLYHNILTQII